MFDVFCVEVGDCSLICISDNFSNFTLLLLLMLIMVLIVFDYSVLCGIVFRVCEDICFLLAFARTNTTITIRCTPVR